MHHQTAVKYLSQQPLLHVDMLQALHRDQADLLAVDSHGVLLYHRTGQLYMLSAQDAQAVVKLTANHALNGELVVAHHPHCLAHLQQAFDLKNMMLCHQVAYLGGKTLPTPQSDCIIKVLDQTHLDFVLAHYSHLPDPDYLLERLQAGVMHGAYLQGQLAGFIGMHGEGSIGLLEVLPQYRRRGIARALQTHMTNWNLEQGYTPFAQVVHGNQPSIQLQQQLGYSIAATPVYWLH